MGLNNFNFRAGNGALWAQPSGENTLVDYLGCHGLGDVDIPGGDITNEYCPDPAGPNRFKVIGTSQGAPGSITTTVTTPVAEDFDELERINCPFTLFAHLSQGGRKDVFTNFDRTFIFVNAQITSRGLSDLATRTPDDNNLTLQTFDITAEEIIRVAELDEIRQTISETQSINDITFCNDEQCRTSQQVAQGACEVGYAVADADTGVPANVLATTNGSTWAATAADPFGNDEHIIAVECFELGRNSVRVIVARGVTDAAAPAEIAYSDDAGATWTSVNVGTTNAWFAPSRFSLFALDRNNIWFGTDSGYIYKSSDAGLSWTAQESGTIHTGDWNAIRFVDENVGWAGGESNIIARTIDGGTGWSAVTGPSAEAGNNVTVVEPLDRNRAWVGYSSGRMYFTLDAGVTWTARAFTGSGAGQVRDIRMFKGVLGFMLSDSASPVGSVHWTIDGGYTWSKLAFETNSGLNALYVCNEWNVYYVGEAHSGTGYIAKASV